MHIPHLDVEKSVVSYFSESKFSEFFIETECPIQMGATSRRADIVLRDGKGTFVAIAECKSSGGSDYGRSQLKSYLSASDTRFGLLAMSPNPNEWIFCERRGGNRFVEIQQAIFEAGILEETKSEPTVTPVETEPQSAARAKPQFARIWRYVAGILGMGLLISIILLLMHSNTPEQPVVQSSTREQPVTPVSTPKQPAAQTNAPEQPAMQSSTAEQSLHLNTLKQLTDQTNTPEQLVTLKQLTDHTDASEQPAVQSSTPEQPVTPLKIPKQLAVAAIGEVALIPAGDFQMGGSDSDAESDEQPVHTVYVDAFYIDKYEVTNAQYKKFIDANTQWQKDNIPRYLHNGNYLKFWTRNTYPPSKANHPVVYVSWYAAMAYAKWASKRLPTEAEWEKAARGGVTGRKYPWGNSIDPTKANYGGEIADTMPIGSYPANDYGLYDMTGNVMEWCLDTYDERFYSHSPSRNPIAGGRLPDIVDDFQSVTSLRSVRSGCWYNVPMHVRVADRYGTLPKDASKGRGFRCAVSAMSLLE